MVHQLVDLLLPATIVTVPDGDGDVDDDDGGGVGAVDDTCFGIHLRVHLRLLDVVPASVAETLLSDR